MKKFKLKTTKPTGRYRSFYPTTYTIKYMGKMCGNIAVDGVNPHVYYIKLQVIKDDINSDGNPNCIWKWVTLTKPHPSPEEAIEFLNLQAERVTQKFNLHLHE